FPMVLVVVSVLDQAAGLRATLEALAGQTLARSSFEVVVVDNGSTDATLEVAADWSVGHPEVRMASEREARGSYAARNRGLEHATAAVIAFTDADCRPDPRWLEAGLAALEGAEVVAGRIEMTFRRGRPNLWEYLDAATWLDQRHYIEAHGFGATANLFVRRRVLEAVGRFRTDLASGGDYELGRRLERHGVRVGYAPDAVVRHPARAGAGAVLAKAKRVARGVQRLERLGLLEHNRMSWRHVMPVRHYPAIPGQPLSPARRLAVAALANGLKCWSLLWRLL
ncbi:MAG TPA: glycosyltransferase, partial [Thermoanaerobaculales bacterium]|nr:glycosyltransferase [Thermoanaerobaculales bacterium]